MKLKKKITNKEYKKYKLYAYGAVLALMLVNGHVTYQNWLDPRGLTVERDPKIHDGSKEFTPPVDFESTVEPAPDEDGTTRYLGPNDLKALDGLTTEGVDISPEDQEILDELKEQPEYPGNVMDEAL